MEEKLVTKKKIRLDFQERKQQMLSRQKQPWSLCERNGQEANARRALGTL